MQIDEKLFDEILKTREITKCKNCQYYKALYIPPCQYLDGIREALNATTRSCRVCSAWLEEANEVMWLGQGKEADEGHCEMFVERRTKE